MTNQIKVNSLKAWALGIRPTSLAGALMTVVVGASLAHNVREDLFSWPVTVLCGVFACLMQVGANLINDVVDLKRGNDRPDPQRMDRIYANGLLTLRAMWTGVGVALSLGALVGLSIFMLVRENLPWGGYELLLLGAVVIAFTFLYSTTFAYHGLGDLAVLLCFGIIPVCGTYYVLTYSLSWSALWASIIAGSSIDTLLIINNYRDRDEDPLSHKITSVVLFGETFGRYLYLFAGLLCILMVVLLYLNHHISVWGLMYATIPYAVLHIGSWMKIQHFRMESAYQTVYLESPRNFMLLGILVGISLW